jgi:dienelactone hydrolase
MRAFTCGVLSILFTSAAFAAIQTKPIEYKAGDATLRGVLAWDDSVKEKRPGVIVVHEWWGNNDYPQRRARELAELGYVGFAVDMYGDGKTTSDPKQAEQWATAVMHDRNALEARARAALDTLRAQPQVDPQRVAAIGYCFGGGVVLAMARLGMDLDGVVSFHGTLATRTPAARGAVKSRVLVLTGEADDFVPPQQVEAFRREMDEAGVTYDVKTYPDAQHAFTNPDADKTGLKSVKYDAKADRQSWEEMRRFLSEVFGN